MGERTVKQLKKGREAALKRRLPWESSWRDAYALCLPQRDIMDNRQPGQPKGERVFDSTAINSIQSAANRVQTDLFPSYMEFVEIAPGPMVPDDVKDQAVAALDDASKKFHAAIQRSNFSVVINEFLLDLMVGTGVMMFDEGTDQDPFRFVATSPPTVMLEEGPWGSVGGVYRDHKDMTVSQIRQMWTDAKIPSDWEKKAQENPDEGFDFSEATYYDLDEDLWYYELWRDKEEDKLLEAPRTFDTTPWITTRYAKAANEVYGRGPILQALPDIRTLNRTIELLLMNASLAVTGAFTGVNDGVLNPSTAKIAPGVIIPVARNAGHPQGASLAKLESAGNFDATQLITEDMRGNVRRMLFDRGLPEPQGTPMSATETLERLRQFTLDTGPTFARIMDELVTPLVIRGLRILSNKALINFPFDIDGNTIQVQVRSPLARNQGLDEVQSVMRSVELSSALGPELVSANFKVEDIPLFIASKLGMDPNLLRSEQERGDITQMVADAMAANLTGEAPGGAGGGPAPDPNNPDNIPIGDDVTVN